jgi:hypothetical protein
MATRVTSTTKFVVDLGKSINLSEDESRAIAFSIQSAVLQHLAATKAPEIPPFNPIDGGIWGMYVPPPGKKP